MDGIAKTIRELKREGLSVLLCEQDLRFHAWSRTALVSSRKAGCATPAPWRRWTRIRRCANATCPFEDRPMPNLGLLLTMTEVPPELDAEFNDWYDREHLRNGWRSRDSFRRAAGRPT